MKKRIAAVLLLGVALGATAQQRDKSPPMPTINVDVRDGRVVVSPNGQSVTGVQGTVTWWITAAGYRFASSGIDFGDAQGYFSCARLNGGQGLRCAKSDQAPSGSISYTLRLVDAQQAPVDSDPGIFIQNE